MAADDTTETFTPSTDSSHATTHSDAHLAPSIAVREWVVRRMENAGGSVTVGVVVLAGRWLFRVESGAVASVIDQPHRDECSAADVANALRRWARGAGLDARVDATPGAEIRVQIASPTATLRS